MQADLALTRTPVDLDIGAAGNAATDPARPVWPPATAGPTRFEAVTAGGTIVLQLGAAPARHATEAALRLAALDALLDGLDGWSGEPLDWRWIDGAAGEAAAAPASGATAWGTICDAEPAPRELDWRLELPWTWLRARSAPTAALAGLLRWKTVPAVVTIARLSIAADEAALLEPGGALLLPASLCPGGWSAWLHARDEAPEDGLGVDLSSHESPRLTARKAARPMPATLPASDSGGWIVQAEPAQPLAPEVLAGWSVDVRLALAPRVVLRRVEDREAQACGRLIPWGAGCALLLDTVRKPADQR